MNLTQSYRVTNGQKFRFGGVKVFTAIEVRAPVMVGRRHYKLSWFIVNAPIPCLWGKESMKKGEVILDLHQGKVKVKGEWSKLQTDEGSPYRIELLPKLMSVVELRKEKLKDGKNDSVKSSNAEDKESDQVGNVEEDENVGDFDQYGGNNSNVIVKTLEDPL